MNPIDAAVPEPTYRQHPEVLHTQLSESEAVLLSLPAAQYYTLNETGSRIWQVLGDGATPMDVARALEGEYEIELAQALAVARGYIDELLREGLIQEEGAGQLAGGSSP
jgi:hypothetical protein